MKRCTLLLRRFASIKFTRANQTKHKLKLSNIIKDTITSLNSKNKNIVSFTEQQQLLPNSLQSEPIKPDNNNFWETPLTPVANAGIAIGASLLGLKSIVQFSTMSQGMQAIDHIVNSSAKLRYMSGNILAGAPIFRAINGPVEGFQAQNSQCYAAWYGSIPGLITVAPYDLEDYQGLFRTALKSNDPVVFLQESSQLRLQQEVSAQVVDENFSIPFGKAKIMQRGRHVTLVAYAQNVKLALDASKTLLEKGIQCQVINLRSIKPLDLQTITSSVRKTGRIVTIQNGYPVFGVGAHISSVMFEKCFQWLDAPLVRVTARDVSLAYSSSLEKMIVPQVSDVIKGVQKVMKGVKLG